MPPIARVEPLTTARALRGPFDYALPPALAGVDVGSVLVVPFGRQRILGVVVDLARTSDVPADKLVAPISALEAGVPPDLVRLAQWIAADTCSTPARALSLVLPPGAGERRGRERMALAAELTADGRAALAGAERLGSRQRALLAALDARGGAGAAASLGPGAHAGLRRLEARGLVTLADAAVRARPAAHAVGGVEAEPLALTPAQAAALAEIEAALAAGAAPGERSFLLHGVTGSGKTEVYLRAAAAALASGRGAIVLVPEIGLTPQAVGRFQARFGDTVAVLHSALSAAERRDEWLRLRRGEARVCVGPRSAVFAPVAGLGLVIVDEEHDASYKHEGDPRYDARRVAARRAEQAGAVLVAGSATPRPETVRALRRLRLPARVDGRALPPVQILDMRDAPNALHPETHAALADVRRRGEKAVVLLNRRGWSNFLSCRSCGEVRECPQCDVALILHRSEGIVACHHCGHREPAGEACPACGSRSVARHGAGTERLASELAEALGTGRGFPVVRLDADVAGAGRSGAAAALARFDAAPAGVLIGTQMVAKGHDFPDVTLAAILDADATLRFPDFRAEERTFALVTQLAGRAGRGPRGGRVLVQTLAPDAPAILHAAAYDADGFLAGELARREFLRYPPFSDLIRIVCASPEPGAAARAAGAVRAALQPPGAQVLGPAPLFRLRGKERSQVVVKAGDRAAAVRAVGAAVEGAARDRAHRGVAFSVDVDPQ
ncbi:MAG: primosomal protein N' [Solirubrobacteraceae bacterium]